LNAALPPPQDFNYLLQVGNKADRGRPRITAAKLCTTFPSCKDRGAFAICPNVYRDCGSGALKRADPTQRCNSWAVCEPVELDGAAGGGGKKNTAARAAPGAAAAAAALLGVGALLALA
jgi:hypothetical protein